VSARHQVKRLDRFFKGVRSYENRSGRRNRFSSFGADLMIRNFTGGLKASIGFELQVKSGPDVFADALVLYAAADDARRACPNFPHCRSDHLRRSRGGQLFVSRTRGGTLVPARRARTQSFECADGGFRGVRPFRSLQWLSFREMPR
jgi:hypothetical protein